MLNFNKTDKYGQVIKPGDVVAYHNKFKGVELVVYQEEAGGSKAKGTYGRFITDTGITSIKYSSVAFVFDSLYQRRASGREVRKAIKRYYEGIR